MFLKNGESVKVELHNPGVTVTGSCYVDAPRMILYVYNALLGANLGSKLLESKFFLGWNH